MQLTYLIRNGWMSTLDNKEQIRHISPGNHKPKIKNK